MVPLRASKYLAQPALADAAPIKIRCRPVDANDRAKTADSGRCGELRWSDKEHGWEVLIPSNAFKNANSSFFGSKPFRLILPDLLDLYKYLNACIERHRGVLLANAKDPGTLFVKTVKTTSKDADYDQTTFYEAWRLVIQRYGIYNPYTGRGAIKGLLPHGPHNVRDVSRHPCSQADRLLRAGELRDPGHGGDGGQTLWPVPAAGQGGTGSEDSEPGLGGSVASQWAGAS